MEPQNFNQNIGYVQQPYMPNYYMPPMQGEAYYYNQTQVAPPPKKHIGLIVTICCLLAVGVIMAGLLFGAAVLIVKDRTNIQDTLPNQSEQQQTEPFDDKDRPSQEDAPKIEIKGEPEGDALLTEDIVAKVKPCVVGILTYEGKVTKTLVGSGSGIIISQDGYIVTNAHVVDGATAMETVLDSGAVYSAQLVGIDIKTDLAVIKISETNLPVAEFGNSDTIAVGGKALAIGNPGGFANTVTQGIFSGINREITVKLSDGSNATFNLIQTDAAINPGNSGGALVNKYGQVVGINSVKISSVQYEGLGFAIPVNVAKPIIDDLIVYGYVKDRAKLGITVVAVGSTTLSGENVPDKGLYISSITSDSPLKNTDVQEGDVIISVNGKATEKITDLTSIIDALKPGDNVTLLIYHQSSEKQIEITVALIGDND